MDQIAEESDAVFVKRAAMWVLGLFALTAVVLAAMASTADPVRVE